MRNREKVHKKKLIGLCQLAKQALPSPTFIEPEVLYSKEEVQRRMAAGDGKMREAFGQGLKCYRWGERKYILGREFIAWLTGTESGNGSK